MYLFYNGIRNLGGTVLNGEPPTGAFYAFLRINPTWKPESRLSKADSQSWAFVEHLIRQARIGCVPGVDFGPHGEGYVRFCFARNRAELTGALDAMQRLFSATH